MLKKFKKRIKEIVYMENFMAAINIQIVSIKENKKHRK